jgi:diguanylate cyclase (GGDEF)-like protein/PAS domain S-box-containing protein
MGFSEEQKKLNLILPKGYSKENVLDYLGQILDELSDGVYVVDTERRILFWNRGAERLTGFTREEVVGRKCGDNILDHVDEEGASLCFGACPLVETMRTGTCGRAELYLRHKEGYRKAVSVNARPLADAEGRIIGAVETFSDNSPMKSALTEITHLRALTLLDPLTELGNRRFIDFQLQMAIAAIKRYEIPSALLVLDVDFFKDVNDSHGHEVGDRALVLVAHTLKCATRETDHLGRIGGDEFVAILQSATESDLRSVGQRCVTMTNSSMLRHQTLDIPVRISAGGTCIRLDDTPESALRRADKMMYRAKEEGKGRLSIG